MGSFGELYESILKLMHKNNRDGFGKEGKAEGFP